MVRHNNQLPDNLPQLQNLIKRDPESYRDEFLQQYQHFLSVLDIFRLEPDKENKSLCESIMFLSQVAQCYLEDMKTFPQTLVDLLKTHSTTLDPEMRNTFCRALILLRNKNLISPLDLLELFFQLLRCPDKALRTFLENHIITDIKNMNAKQKDMKLNSTLQSFMYTMLRDTNPKAAKMSADIMIELYRKQVWNDAKTVNVLANIGCFSKVTKVMVASLKFFLGTDQQEEEEDDDSDREVDLKGIMMAAKINKKTKKRKNKVEAAKKLYANAQKKKKKAVAFNFSAIHLIHNPQGMAENLFKQLQDGNERFEVKLMHLDVISRLIGIHELFLFSFYPYITRFIQPHQRQVTRILQFGAQASHELVPPDIIEPVIKTLVNNFVTERNSSDVMAIGLNAVREICVRCPLAMNEDLLRDLTMYKSYKEKSVMMAAKSLILLYRAQMPTLLAKKDRGRPTEASIEIKPKRYGEVLAVDHIPGTEALLREDAPELEEDESSAEEGSDSGDWVDVDSSEDEGDLVLQEERRKKGITMIKTSKNKKGNEDHDSSDDEDTDEEDDEDEGEWEECSDEDVAEEEEEQEDSSEKKVESSKAKGKKAMKKGKEKETPSEGTESEGNEQTLNASEAMQELALTKIFTDADFARIEQERVKKQITHHNRKRQIETERSEFVKLDSIEMIYKRRKADKEARVESMQKGREGREKFGFKDNRLNPHCSTTNREKRKNKNFSMIRHKARGSEQRFFPNRHMRKGKAMFSTKLMLFTLACCSLLVVQCDAEPYYANMPVSNIPLYMDGIYFEQLKPIKVQVSTWTLRADYDIAEFIDEIATANRTVAHLLKACADMRMKNVGNCEGVNNILALTKELNDFSALLSSMCEEPDSVKRTKRGVFRSWFGLMDDEDRTEISRNFDAVNHQIAIESSSLKMFYNTTNQALAVLTGNMFQVDPKKPHTIDFTREGQLLLMDILLNKIIAKKNLFMQLLQSTTSMGLSDSIISPNKLLEELEKVQRYLPQEFIFPVALKLREVIKLYPLSQVVAYVDGCRLAVNILLPLCNRLLYRTLKGTTVPSLQDGVATLIVLERDIVAFNETSHSGMVMSYGDYKACTHLTDFALCNSHHLMRNLTTTDDCIAATYFNNTQRDSNCRTTRLQLRSQMWVQLADPNAWIYVVPNFTDITVQYESDRVKYLTLHGVGMLKLLRMCHVRSMDVLLQYIPQLGGSRIKLATEGFSLPVTITREQSLIISASPNENSRVIPVGKFTESDLRDPSLVAGIYREPGGISPWAVRCFIRIPANRSPVDGIQKDTNLVPRSLAEPLAVAINGQINMEYGTSYVYRSISYHFASSNVCLLGLADFYRKLATEENEHAELLADVLLLRNGRVVLEPIAEPPEREWSANVGETVCETIDLEMKLSQSLSLVYAVAEKQRDVMLLDFLTTRFLHQQCESLRTLQQLATKWNQLRGAPDGVYRFDREVRKWSVSAHPTAQKHKR
uniref:Protein SDA1 homolog n=1 Tax=Anopheles atroparvus TaxID=41427 RepID=A0A182IJL2_ANOAO